jgi:hypothetical protein
MSRERAGIPRAVADDGDGCWVKGTAMDYTFHQVQWALCGVRVLPIVAWVAIVSYVVRSRLAFILGTLGTLLGFLILDSSIVSGGNEAQCVEHLTEFANCFAWWGIVGSSVGLMIGGCVAPRGRRGRAE